MKPIKSLKYIGTEVIYLSSIPSTNDYAAELISKSKSSNGTVIYTYNQTNGKGQRNRSWFSEAGKGICASVIINLDFLPVEKIYLFNKAMALAVREFIYTQTDLQTFIKWPNDIIVNQKKISGILIQNVLAGQKIKNSIVGIGINVSQESFPKDLPNGISLKQISKKEYDFEFLVLELLNDLEKYYLMLMNDEFEEIEQSFLTNLYKKGVLSKFILNGNEEIEARILDVNAKGQIGLEYNGQMNYWNHGEIEFLL